jgi:predicted MPP superfamily phosphohydrolase
LSAKIAILGLAVLAVFIWYAPWRLAALTGRGGRIWPWRLALAAVMGGYLVAMRLRIFATGSEKVASLYLLWAIVFIFLIYSFLLLLVFHGLGRASGIIASRPRLQAAAAAALALALAFYQIYRVQYYAVSEHVVPVPGLEEPVTVFHVVDLHLGAFRGERFLKKILEEIEARRPDIVIWNGDLASGNLALDDSLFELLATVKAEQYYTNGNHELDLDTRRLAGLLEKAGIEVLRSRMVETHGLQLIGLEYMNAGDFEDEAEMATDLTISEVLPSINRDRSKPTVLFHHSPVGLRHAAIGDVDVFLAGNSHAGQKSPIASMFRLSYPVWASGVSEVGHMAVLVSQGGGDYGSWFRFGSPYVFQMITLVPG